MSHVIYGAVVNKHIWLQECAHKVLVAGLFIEDMQTPFEFVAESSLL